MEDEKIEQRDYYAILGLSRDVCFDMSGECVGIV